LGLPSILFQLSKNVKGLVPGNNVRFQGIDVGTVKSIEMANDSSIHLVLYIQKKMQPYIKKNAITSIATDGLMGNKIIHIIPQDGFAEHVEEGDVLYSKKGVDSDQLMEKLDQSTDYLEATLINLAQVSDKLNQSEALWRLLSDEQLPSELKNAIHEFRIAGSNAASLTKTGKDLMLELEQGKGIVQQLFKDSVLAENLDESIENILKTSADAASVVEEVKGMMDKIESGEGTAGLILTDSIMRESLMNSMMNIEQSTENFNQNMEALKGSFLFRKYYKKQEKELKKAEKKSNK
jgi:phospholipid/cholesterol/gamma-HCH transport system substrate-binding protein